MHCLVVDPNLAFATLLSEELLRLGHKVTTCASGAEAIAAVHASRTAPPAEVQLALLDMALQSPDALTLGHQLRAVLPAVRLVLIPMIGDEPVLDRDAPAIQGVLPKPFFLPELSERIEAALRAPLSHAPVSWAAGMPGADFTAPLSGAGEDGSDDLDLSSLDWLGTLGEGSDGTGLLDDSLSESAGASQDAGDDVDWLHAFAVPPVETGSEPAVAVAPQPVAAPVQAPPLPEPVEAASPSSPAPGGRTVSRRALRANQDEIEAVMRDLVNEVGADAVLLTGDTGVLAWAGSLGEGEVASISAAVLESRRASEEVARILGREQLRFEQSIAGGSYLLYALDIHDAVLAVTVSGSAPLGLLRHHTRSAGERIAALCTAGLGTMA